MRTPFNFREIVLKLPKSIKEKYRLRLRRKIGGLYMGNRFISLKRKVKGWVQKRTEDRNSKRKGDGPHEKEKFLEGSDWG